VCHITSSSVTCPAVQNFSTLSHKLYDLKQLLNIKHVFFIFSKNLSETFLILRRVQRDMIKPCCNDRHVHYLLSMSDLNETWILSTDFQEISKYKIFSAGTELFHAGGHKDRHDEVNHRSLQFCEKLLKIILKISMYFPLAGNFHQCRTPQYSSLPDLENSSEVWQWIHFNYRCRPHLTNWKFRLQVPSISQKILVCLFYWILLITLKSSIKLQIYCSTVTSM